MKPTRMMLIAMLSACALGGTAPHPALAQDGGANNDLGGGLTGHTVAPPQFNFIPPSSSGQLPPPMASSATASVPTTTRIVSDITTARDFCARVGQKEYVIDCLADRLDTVAGTMPRGGDYDEAREAIGAAADELRSLARSNADPDLRRARLREAGTGGQSSSRPITPVRSDALAALNAQAATILEQAETVLLRSAENSERRMVHYQRIADAVGSTKVLLRSL